MSLALTLLGVEVNLDGGVTPGVEDLRRTKEQTSRTRLSEGDQRPTEDMSTRSFPVELRVRWGN